MNMHSISGAYQPDIRDDISISAHEVTTSALRLAHLAEQEPRLVALEHPEIRAAIATLKTILEKTTHRSVV